MRRGTGGGGPHALRKSSSDGAPYYSATAGAGSATTYYGDSASAGRRVDPPVLRGSGSVSSYRPEQPERAISPAPTVPARAPPVARLIWGFRVWGFSLSWDPSGFRVSELRACPHPSLDGAAAVPHTAEGQACLQGVPVGGGRAGFIATTSSERLRVCAGRGQVTVQCYSLPVPPATAHLSPLLQPTWHHFHHCAAGVRECRGLRAGHAG